MRYGKAPPSPWYFSLPQGYPGAGIYQTPGAPYHPSGTVRLGGVGSNTGFGLAMAVTAGILLAAGFTVLVSQK
jgi:hypothetical protein